jgi:hypothetical protein
MTTTAHAAITAAQLITLLQTVPPDTRVKLESDEPEGGLADVVGIDPPTEHTPYAVVSAWTPALTPEPR